MPMIGRRFYPGMKRGAMGFMQSGDFPVPVGYWKFGENAGTVAKDSSPEENDGTIHGASWVKGYLGPGLSFDAVDDYVDISNPETFVYAKGSIVFRMAPSVIPKSGDILHFHEVEFTDYLAIHYRNGSISLGIEDDNVLKTYLSSVPLLSVVDKFTQVAITGDGVSSRIYFNESEIAVTGTNSGYWTSHLTPIGFLFGKAGWSKFPGILDELLIFDEALTTAQIRQIYLGYR